MTHVFIPHSEPPLPHIYCEENISDALADYIIKISKQSIQQHGKFIIAVSGGSLPRQLKGLVKRKDEIDWSGWYVFLADERLVPLDHMDSNYHLLQKEFLQYVPIPKDQIYPINTSLLDDPEALSDDYMERLRQVFAAKNAVKFPVFDLILLGVGLDGHTCSLFPNHPLLEETMVWIAPILDSPKPPPQRITLTLPVLNHAHHIIFICTGKDKQDILRRVLSKEHEHLPVTMVRPKHGHLIWFLDKMAAFGLDQLDTIVPITSYSNESCDDNKVH
jgi:6-phosphogluconolactonase